MTIQDMATKLGFTYTTKKTLVETTNNTFYSRIDHIITDNNNPDKPPMIFRDRGSVNLYLESKAQLELSPGASQRPKKH